MPDQLEQVGVPRSGVRFDTDIYYLQFPIYIFPNCSVFRCMCVLSARLQYSSAMYISLESNIYNLSLSMHRIAKQSLVKTKPSI